MSWLVLLPPSRGVRDGGDGPVWRDTHLADGTAGSARRKVIAAARTLRGGDLEAAIGGASAAADARRWLRDIHRAPTMAAVERYAGVVYEHLDVRSLPPDARHRARERVMIPSGLFGPLVGGDPIPPYRLLMLARLPAPVGGLAGFWRPHVADHLEAGSAPGTVVIDLLSSEYVAAVPAEARRRQRWVTVELVGPDRRRVPGTIGKQCKGRLARHLLAVGDASADAADAVDGMRLLDDADDHWVLQV